MITKPDTHGGIALSVSNEQGQEQDRGQLPQSVDISLDSRLHNEKSDESDTSDEREEEEEEADDEEESEANHYEGVTADHELNLELQEEDIYSFKEGKQVSASALAWAIRQLMMQLRIVSPSRVSNLLISFDPLQKNNADELQLKFKHKEEVFEIRRREDGHWYLIALSRRPHSAMISLCDSHPTSPLQEEWLRNFPANSAHRSTWTSNLRQPDNTSSGICVYLNLRYLLHLGPEPTNITFQPEQLLQVRKNLFEAAVAATNRSSPSLRQPQHSLSFRKLAITNLLSFIGTTELTFHPLLILVGPNGSGKTNVFRALELVLETCARFENPGSTPCPPGYVRASDQETHVTLSVRFPRLATVLLRNYETRVVATLIVAWIRANQEELEDFLHRELKLEAGEFGDLVAFVSDRLTQCEDDRALAGWLCTLGDYKVQGLTVTSEMEILQHVVLTQCRAFATSLTRDCVLSECEAHVTVAFPLGKTVCRITFSGYELLPKSLPSRVHIKVNNYASVAGVWRYDVRVTFPGFNPSNSRQLAEIVSLTIVESVGVFRQDVAHLAVSQLLADTEHLTVDRRFAIINRLASSEGSSLGLLDKLPVAARSSLAEVLHVLRDGLFANDALNRINAVSGPMLSIYFSLAANNQVVFGSSAKGPWLDLQLASGATLHALHLFFTLHGSAAKGRSVFILDEPVHMFHPDKQRQFRAHLQRLVSLGNQVIMSTHSAAFLDFIGPSAGPATVVRVSRDTNNSSFFFPVDLDQVVGACREFVLQMGGHEVFFSEKVVFVEGKTDLAFWRAVQELDRETSEPKYHSLRFVELTGCGSVFKALYAASKCGIPYVAIVDADKLDGLSRKPESQNIARAREASEVTLSIMVRQCSQQSKLQIKAEGEPKPKFDFFIDLPGGLKEEIAKRPTRLWGEWLATFRHILWQHKRVYAWPCEKTGALESVLSGNKADALVWSAEQWRDNVSKLLRNLDSSRTTFHMALQEMLRHLENFANGTLSVPIPQSSGSQEGRHRREPLSVP